ncbi:hypothetical protein [Saccharopolyspora taberi]|uniref:Uncharacterized protein n=1 Tax=Saccharopolyspora taberi TaxID=60895 RepID=A0ABN3VLZ1_9PSEU
MAEEKKEADGEDKKRKLDISPAQVTGAALASVTAAFLGSTLGAVGTLWGAALTSVVITVGGKVYQMSLERTKEQAEKASVLKRLRKPGALSAAGDGEAGGEPGESGRDGATRVESAGSGRAGAGQAGTAQAGIAQAGPGNAGTGTAGAGKVAPAESEQRTRFLRTPAMHWPGGEQVVDDPNRTRRIDRAQVDQGAADTRLVGRGDADARLESQGADDTQLARPSAADTQLVGQSAADTRLVGPGSDDTRLVGQGADTQLVSPNAADPRLSDNAAEPTTMIAPPEQPDRRIRWRRWGVAAASSALAFALCMLIVTGFEGLTGRSLSGDGGTTIGEALHRKAPPVRDEQPAPTPEPSTTQKPTTSARPTGEPTSEPTQAPSPTQPRPTEQPTVQPRPTGDPSPTQERPEPSGEPTQSVQPSVQGIPE